MQEWILSTKVTVGFVLAEAWANMTFRKTIILKIKTSHMRMQFTYIGYNFFGHYDKFLFDLILYVRVKKKISYVGMGLPGLSQY